MSVVTELRTGGGTCAIGRMRTGNRASKAHGEQSVGVALNGVKAFVDLPNLVGQRVESADVGLLLGKRRQHDPASTSLGVTSSRQVSASLTISPTIITSPLVFTQYYSSSLAAGFLSHTPICR
ncbi:hypothetical protein [Stenotrophomonas sp. NA06056]|uniref:hypothetical protein n=1 Tax=Stenotrophomonas sp. NA06056 TaxID=2742129 RepID=UPI00158DC5B5|nr:hypothetical protein [Stenotrophomonas sp. NA06056]QKW55052.1 hypothetical protein HUT07_09250 [Stenotrophomonas sp. NA06056]